MRRVAGACEALDHRAAVPRGSLLTAILVRPEAFKTAVTDSPRFGDEVEDGPGVEGLPSRCHHAVHHGGTPGDTS
jgi:hypothetical protein